MADATVSQEDTTKVQKDEEAASEEQPEYSEEKGRVLEDWETSKYRAKVIERIQDEITKTESQIPKSATYLEDFVFSKAKSKKEYLDLVANVVVYVAKYNSKKLKEKEAEAEGEAEEKNESESENATQES